MEEKKRKAVYSPEADARWIAENKAHKNYLNRRSNARGFIRSFATKEDLLELESMINERLSDE